MRSKRLQLDHCYWAIPSSPEEAAQVVAAHVRKVRKLDEANWSDVIARAEEASKGTPYPDLAAHDAAIAGFIGICTKDCYGVAIMVKGSVRRFLSFGIYVCSGCGWAYGPEATPERAGRGVDGFLFGYGEGTVGEQP